MLAETIHFSIVIPFYNNIKHLEQCFPSVYDLYKRHTCVKELVAIDDCSSDETAWWMSQYYPDVRLLQNFKNCGFGQSTLKGIQSAQSEWVILLNSDIKIISDIIPPLKESISRHKDLFAISFYSFNEEGRKLEGRKQIVRKTGLFKVRNNFSNEYQNDHLYTTFYACGGHCLLSREKFLKLNGFSPIFEPFYWEDVDLCYRAMKRGWSVFFDPRCKVVHYHQGSISTSHPKQKIRLIQTRNKILFFWKNGTSLSLWLYHISGMLFRLLTSWVAGDFLFYAALSSALKRLIYITKDKEKTFWMQKRLPLFKVGSNF